MNESNPISVSIMHQKTKTIHSSDLASFISQLPLATGNNIQAMFDA